MEKGTDNVSDGYHTFGELYDHRRALTRIVLLSHADMSWRSKQHHPDDKPMFEGGYFVVGMFIPNIGQISYHYKLSHWEEFDGVEERIHAPKWDGHTPQDVVARLLKW